ncbi:MULTISPECIES: hypothetical protein [Actinoalloteichus]|nr:MULTISPECIES: hypothetical protein [Actinoalloteichus]
MTSTSNTELGVTLHVEQPPRNTIVEISMSRWITYQPDITSHANMVITHIDRINPDGTGASEEYPASEGRNMVARNAVTTIHLAALVRNAHARALANVFHWPIITLREAR